MTLHESHVHGRVAQNIRQVWIIRSSLPRRIIRANGVWEGTPRKLAFKWARNFSKIYILKRECPHLWPCVAPDFSSPSVRNIWAHICNLYRGIVSFLYVIVPSRRGVLTQPRVSGHHPSTALGPIEALTAFRMCTRVIRSRENSTGRILQTTHDHVGSEQHRSHQLPLPNDFRCLSRGKPRKPNERTFTAPCLDNDEWITLSRKCTACSVDYCVSCERRIASTAYAVHILTL